MPEVGDLVKKFNRWYVCVNPDESEGPSTWRLAVPDESLANGGGGSTAYDFSAELPIEVEVTAGFPTQVDHTIDIQKLPER